MPEIEAPLNTSRLALLKHDLHIEVNLSLVPEKPGLKILDLGAGSTGSYVAKKLTERTPSASVVELDYHSSNFRERENKPEASIIGNAIELPFKDASFDLVITSEITQDNPFFDKEGNRQLLAHEISRVLALGGHYVIYHEDEDIIIPQGMIPLTVEKGEKKLNEDLTLQGLLFGVYEKVAPEIDVQNVGLNASLIDQVHVETYTDKFLEELLRYYPPDQILPTKPNWGLLLQEMFGKYELELELRKALSRAIKEKRWMVIRSHIPHARELIAGLKSQKHIPKISFEQEFDAKYILWQMIRSPYFHVTFFDDFVVTYPSQKALDLVVERMRKL